jgi:hypothetical protein
MDIHVFHNYNKLVRRNLVEPIECECGNELTIRADAEGEPYFECFYCNSKTIPGERFYLEIRGVVNGVFN